MYLTGKWVRLITLGYGASLLCNAEGGAGGSGGAAAFTQEHWDEVDKRVAAVVNSALTGRLKTFEKQLGEKIEGTLGSILDKKLEGYKAPVADPDGAGGKNDKNKDNVALATIQRQLEVQKADIERISAERDTERKKNRDTALRTKSTEGLTKIGITDPFMAKVALAHLREEGRIGLESDDSDNLVWNDETGSVSFETGLRSWAKTEEAKRFLPASGAKGSGSRPGGLGSNGAPDPAAARDEFFGNILANALRNQ